MSSTTATIAVLPGDGVGPEVTREAVRALRAVANRFGLAFAFEEKPVGGAAIDASGDPLPQETLEACTAADAVLLGAVGGPQWDDPAAKVRPEQGLLRLRKSLSVFANLRPVRVHPALAARSPIREELIAGADMLIVRELTGGIYFGDKRTGGTGDTEFAVDEAVYTAPEIERVARVAFEAARRRRNKVASLDKANVLETSRLWRRTVSRVARDEFPDVQLEHIFIDAAAMHVITDPGRFDVVLTTNMFGDIISDETSVLAGSLGLLGSASIGEGRPGLFEPIHGSAPDIAGTGKANPLGAITAAAMLLREGLGLEEPAQTVEAAVDATLRAGSVTPDLGGTASTHQVGTSVAGAIAQVVPAAMSPA